jgi:hypothetical protein
MKIQKKTVAVIGAVGALTAAIFASTVGAAYAAEPNGSAAAFYLVSGNDGSALAPASTLAYTDAVAGSPLAVNDGSGSTTMVFHGPSATGVRVFISPRGSETNPAAWTAYSPGFFVSGSTTDVNLPTVSLSSFTNGNPANIKGNGGDFSLGLAYTSNNGNTVLANGAFYTYITVTQGTGAWTFQSPTAANPCVANPALCQTGQIGLNATTLAAADGALSLNVPAGASATIGNPVLVNGLSTSTGTLPQFTVSDARVVSHPGWTLSSSVADFTYSGTPANSISKAQLGLEPVIVSTTAGGVTKGATQVAGSAVYSSDFAKATNAAQIGTTTLGGNLTFVAPVGKPAGTYTSTLTLTLVSGSN